VDIVNYLGKECDYPAIEIVSGAINPHLQEPDVESDHKIDLAFALRRYDWTAAKCGFTFGEGTWRREDDVVYNRTLAATKMAVALKYIRETYL
jgi:hypothetical protein